MAVEQAPRTEADLSVEVTSKRPILLCLSIALLICLLGADIYVYCARLGCKTKIDANMIVSPFDRSSAPPLFIQRKNIRVKDVTKSVAKPKIKPETAMAASAETKGSKSVNSESGYRHHRRYRRAAYAAPHRTARNLIYAPKQQTAPKKMDVQRAASDGAVDAAFIPVEPPSNTKNTE